MWSDLPDDVELIERKVRVKGFDINHVMTKLKGSRPEKVLLLLPGLLGSSYLEFKPQLYIFPRLLPNYSIIAWDPIGFGKSLSPNYKFGFDMFDNNVEFLKGFVDELKISKFSILGVSGGGLTSAKFAVKYPENMDKLILAAASSFRTQEETDVAKNFIDPDTWSDAMRKPLYDFYGRDYVREIWASFVNGMQEIMNERGGDYCRHDLKFIKAETLVILGEYDMIVDLSHGQVFMENIPNCQLIIFPKGTHKMNLKYPEEFSKIVAEFLERKAKL